MRILVTGFDPFNNETINPAIESVKQLPDMIDGVEVFKLEIPTVMNKSLDLMKQKVLEIHPDVVVSVGQAGGRSQITIERVSININDYPIPDNEGNQVVDTPVIENGPSAYFSTLPIKAMVQALNKSNIPASISNTAGTFICNHVAYGIAHLAATEYPNMKTGFIHIPYLDVQVEDKEGMPSMKLEEIVKALEICLRTIINVNEDVKITGGKQH